MIVRVTRMVMAVAAVVVVGALTPGGAFASSAPVFKPAIELSALPTGAVAGSTQNAVFNGVACTGAGDCVAGGYYSDAGTVVDIQAMIAAETNGKWRAATKVELPAGAATGVGAQNAAVQAVTCTGPGDCVVGGYYTDTHGARDTQAMVVTEKNGSWGAASELTLPTGGATAAGGQSAVVLSLTCTSLGDCTGVGQYKDAGEGLQAMALTEKNWVWRPASELTLPSDAATAAGSQNAALNGLACTSAGDCVAVGYYSESIGDDEAMAATETNGIWGLASELVLPTDAGAEANAQFAELDALWCSDSDGCTAVGQYSTAGDGGEPMATVSPATGPSLGQPAVRVRGTDAVVTVSCTGPTGQHCHGMITLSVVDQSKGHSVVAVTGRLSKPTSGTVIVASARYNVACGRMATVTLSPNHAGGALLARRRRLSVELAVTPAGQRKPVSTKAVTLVGPAGKRRSHGHR